MYHGWCNRLSHSSSPCVKPPPSLNHTHTVTGPSVWNTHTHTHVPLVLVYFPSSDLEQKEVLIAHIPSHTRSHTNTRHRSGHFVLLVPLHALPSIIHSLTLLSAYRLFSLILFPVLDSSFNHQRIQYKHKSRQSSCRWHMNEQTFLVLVLVPMLLSSFVFFHRILPLESKRRIRRKDNRLTIRIPQPLWQLFEMSADNSFPVTVPSLLFTLLLQAGDLFPFTLFFLSLLSTQCQFLPLLFCVTGVFFQLTASFSFHIHLVKQQNSPSHSSLCSNIPCLCPHLSSRSRQINPWHISKKEAKVSLLLMSFSSYFSPTSLTFISLDAFDQRHTQRDNTVSRHLSEQSDDSRSSAPLTPLISFCVCPLSFHSFDSCSELELLMLCISSFSKS